MNTRINNFFIVKARLSSCLTGHYEIIKCERKTVMTTKNKTLKAVAPYTHPGFLNFKYAPFEAWKRNGGKEARSHYPWRFLHWLAFRWELPTLWKSRREARLRFMELVSLHFDAFPDYAIYEVVPMFWDCWPGYFENTCLWLRKHNVKTAVFTSRQTAERMQERFSGESKKWQKMNVIWCPEAVDGELYLKGKELKDRSIDLLEFGRLNDKVVCREKLAGIEINGNRILHICTKQNGKFVYTNEQLYEAMGDAKVTITLPRSMTQPEVAGDIETLTQRYWECMFSRMVMVGHAPQELVDFIGYNPVIELRDDISAEDLIADVLENIEIYQSLVDKNRETAERLGSWKVRMKWLMNELDDLYTLKDISCR